MWIIEFYHNLFSFLSWVSYCLGLFVLIEALTNTADLFNRAKKTYNVFFYFTNLFFSLAAPSFQTQLLYEALLLKKRKSFCINSRSLVDEMGRLNFSSLSSEEKKSSRHYRNNSFVQNFWYRSKAYFFQKGIWPLLWTFNETIIY